MQPTKKFSTRAFRNALGSYATGVAVITARGPDSSLAGVTINSFASVSLDPPLVLWSLALNSPSLLLLRNCSHYAINVLAQDQQELSQRFAATRTDKFAGLAFTPGAGDAPLLPGCCAWLECRHEAQHGADALLCGDPLWFGDWVHARRLVCAAWRLARRVHLRGVAGRVAGVEPALSRGAATGPVGWHRRRGRAEGGRG